MFFIIEKSEETTFDFSQNSVKIMQIMETQKVINLLNGSDNEYSKFATKKWYVIDSDSKSNYSHPDTIKFLTTSIESGLCDYSEAYILVTANITEIRTIAAAGSNPVRRKQPLDAATQVVFRNCAPFKNVLQKLMILLLMKQILLILQSLCTI